MSSDLADKRVLIVAACQRDDGYARASSRGERAPLYVLSSAIINKKISRSFGR
jgi:hypothetical protein